ncbi:MAG: aminopeptidase P family protein [Herpetosiphonaceae bacterium]|nr:aminopeptidase P family protein [Herpetosiphonaceae bacterium]
MTDRLVRVQAALAEAELDALAIMPGANMRYVLGLTIHLSERFAVAFCTDDGEIHMVLPELEAPRVNAEAQVPVTLYPWTDAEGYEPALARCIDTIDLDGILGVEYTRMRVLELRAIEELRPVGIVDADPLFSALRMVKDEDELASMRRAAAAVEAGLRAAVAFARPGVTEQEVVKVWEDGMVAAGATTFSFGTIVASGPNSANPHHTPSNRKLALGDLVILDGGAVVDGYCSDITRTVAVGTPPADLQQVYEVVKAANAAGLAVVKPGVSGAQIDQAARAVITQAGFGPQFVHRTGHGLGIEDHEPPYINAGDAAPLAQGTTFTIEPGVYLPGQGGVRIEDDVVITVQGGECLTTFERDLIIVPAH